ncbi:MAG: hypothetical protein IV298_15710 [Cylindrospermopsis raciborskii KL1]|uniref:hypothetical protein n=1 Tax=Cylindrospermopsis raciborskii TaxID=77022 RepID=UPI001A216CFF|nr:hypothetical protein [Cylindrospermopsis raciborskii]MBG0744881.1 hypothetical protein [Cylindrospermopsis raciborskii KL1]
MRSRIASTSRSPIVSTSQMHLAIPILKGNYEDGKSANTLQTHFPCSGGLK